MTQIALTPTTTPTARLLATTDPKYHSSPQQTLRAQRTQRALTPVVVTVPGPTAAKQGYEDEVAVIAGELVDTGPRGRFEAWCWNHLGCNSGSQFDHKGRLDINRNCEINLANPVWAQCLHNAAMNYVANINATETQEALKKNQEATAAVKSTAAAIGTNHTAACAVGSPACYRTPESWRIPSTPNPIPPPTVETSLRELAFQQCFPGGETKSAAIRAAESRGEDTTALKNEFNSIYGGSPCCRVRDQNVCVH